VRVDAALKALHRHIERSHRGHYSRGIETIDVTAAKGDLRGFCRGSVRKYVDRHRTGDDLLKAAHYLLILYQYEHARRGKG
jgi:hypothetical protein